ncbi:ECF-type sigma factor [Piscinibacter sp. XHJ-5]|uniref:ECF-type sigma factor n=1 Tax=Piscinibacter sp. XHJ-5 TaxID=3037797 RepID=UPI0024535CA9|nr:ECF-type sigma factor [Piscinibacter sp. XHJ-5]
MGDVTTLLMAARRGEPLQIDKLFELLYGEMRRIAHAKLRHRPDGVLLDTTSLVHEAYLRLLERDRLQLNDRSHFLAYAARVMRSVVVDVVRENQAERRGGGHMFVTLDTAAGGVSTDGDAVLRIHESLEELSRIDERLVRVVEMRYFVGLDYQEISDALGVSVRTVERDWQKARSFLYEVLKNG